MIEQLLASLWVFLGIELKIVLREWFVHECYAMVLALPQHLLAVIFGARVYIDFYLRVGELLQNFLKLTGEATNKEGRVVQV